MSKIVDILGKSRIARQLFLNGYRRFAPFYRDYLERKRYKWKSKAIFADLFLPLGEVRTRILHGSGLPERELKRKPLVAVCTTYDEAHPAHLTVRTLAGRVKEGLWAEGAVPLEFSVPPLSRPQERELFVDAIECYVRSQWFDAICTVSSDESAWVLLAACARLNLPSICLNAGFFKRDEEELFALLLEPLGVAPPGFACIPGFVAEKQSRAFQAGKYLFELIRKRVPSSTFLTGTGFENAARVWKALGGSESFLSRLFWIASEAGVHLEENRLRRAFLEAPRLCFPSSLFPFEELFIAGGVPAVMKQIESTLHEHPTCTGKTLKSGLQRIRKEQGKKWSLSKIPPREMREAGLERELLSPSPTEARPRIAVANSWVELTPGHVHLRQLAEAVKAGVLEAGGIPYEFNVPAPCDGVGNGNEGMKFILAQRDLIAELVEAHVRQGGFDGVVTISSCDKINPGMLIAAARLNIPTLCVPGGSNTFKIRYLPGASSINHQDYEEMEKKLAAATCATCGACELMGTANTFQCLMEALGMALPGSASIPAYAPEKLKMARRAGHRIVEMVREGLKPSHILTQGAFENAIIADMAIGGSTNTTLHLPAIAHAAGCQVSLSLFHTYSRKIPTLCGVNPNGPYGMKDFHEAGGMPALLKQVAEDLHESLTVTGRSLKEEIKEAGIKRPGVIRPKSRPVRPEGSTAILFGNLAPRGAVVKQSAVSFSMLSFKGRARVFDSEQEALAALQKGTIKPGTVMVIRYEGPRGAPGMPELLSVTGVIDLLGLQRVALVTDGRFSGATSGPCVGHVTPEAQEGGPIAAVRDGDIIEIDIPNRRLTLKLSEEEIQRRLKSFRPKKRAIARGYMRKYREKVGEAAAGAVVQR